MQNENRIATKNHSIATKDPGIRLELEKREAHLHASARRAIQEVIQAGCDLHIIRSQELWRARPEYETWTEYVENHLGFSVDLTTRWQHVYHVAARLQETGLILPENESQAVELSKAPEARQIPIWQQLTSKLEEVNQGLTVDLIKRAIVIDERERIVRKDKEEEQAPPVHKSVGKGVTVTLSDDEEPAPAPPSFTETGEAALDKIKSVCGKGVTQAIYDGRLKVPQRDLIHWAEQEEQLIHNLGYYIVELRWPYKKALNYEEQLIDSDTTVFDLVTLTRARGGRYEFAYEQNRFTVETR